MPTNPLNIDDDLQASSLAGPENQRVLVVDTSALVAIVQGEQDSEAVRNCLRQAERVLMLAASLTELMIVSFSRGIGDLVQRLIDETPIEIVPHDEGLAQIAVEAHRQFGKRNHPARLNFGDCFAYALAKSSDLPLLYVGGDFARTDVRSAL